MRLFKRNHYTAYIYALTKFLETLFKDLKIKHYAKLPKNIAGRCSYKQTG